MNIEEVREYCLSLPGAKEDMPYGPDWLIFRIEGKIFLHMRLDIPDTTIAIKLPPEEGEELREKYDCITPAYHLNKKHWNDIRIESVFSNRQIQNWIEESYHLVLSNLPLKVKQKYNRK
jgi:predicted DNA-binding protein (MmcQ/YjbR family)